MAPTSEPTAAVPVDPLAAGEAGARLVRGGTVRIVAYVAAISTSIVAVPFLTRHLHSGDYGRYGVVTTLMLIATALTEGGIASLGVREFAIAPPERRREFMRDLLGMRIALSFVGGVAAVAFAFAAGYQAVEIEGTAIAAIGLVLASVQVTLTVPLTATLRLGWMAATDFVGPAVTATLLVVLVLAGAPLLPFYGAAVVAYAVDLALTAWLVRHQVSLRPSFAIARWGALLRESFVFAAATALATVYFQVVVVAMSVIANAHQTGIFFLAFRILSVVNGIPVVVVGSAFPILLRAARDDRARLRDAIGLLTEGNLLLGGWL
jgi:O-antigen/teichoic acid export membrane protein